MSTKQLVWFILRLKWKGHAFLECSVRLFRKTFKFLVACAHLRKRERERRKEEEMMCAFRVRFHEMFVWRMEYGIHIRLRIGIRRIINYLKVFSHNSSAATDETFWIDWQVNFPKLKLINTPTVPSKSRCVNKNEIQKNRKRKSHEKVANSRRCGPFSNVAVAEQRHDVSSRPLYQMLFTFDFHSNKFVLIMRKNSHKCQWISFSIGGAPSLRSNCLLRLIVSST